jgi:hypothetical protein
VVKDVVIDSAVVEEDMVDSILVKEDIVVEEEHINIHTKIKI